MASPLPPGPLYVYEWRRGSGARRPLPFRRDVGLLAAAAALLTATACDVPTKLPSGWDTEFRIPLEGVNWPVAEFLPADVWMEGGGGVFAMALRPVSFSRTLAELCPVACATGGPAAVPKPAFQSTFSDAIALPPDVLSAAIETARIDVSVTNHLGFDVLRPGGAEEGTLTVTLRSGGVALAAPVVVSGAGAAFPAGSTMTWSIDVAGPLSGPIVVEVAVDSPAGSPVVVDGSAHIDVTAVPEPFMASAAHVAVEALEVHPVQRVLDLSQVEDFVRDHAKRGFLILRLENPFEVSGQAVLRLAAPGVDISRTFSVAPGTTERILSYDQEEVRQLAGKLLDETITAVVSGPAGGVPVTPAQVVGATYRLHVVLGPEVTP